MAKITKHCSHCDSELIYFDANAGWDATTETYVMVSLISTDQAYCTICEDEEHIITKHDGIRSNA